MRIRQKSPLSPRGIRDTTSFAASVAWWSLHVSFLSIVILPVNFVLRPATTANAIHAGARYEFNLRPRIYAFLFTDFDEDALQHLDLRNDLGAGLGYHLVKTAKTQFDVFGGLSFNQEYFGTYAIASPAPPPALLLEASQSRHSAEVVVGETLSTKLGPRTTLSEQLSFFPNLSSAGDDRVTLDANATTKLKTWLGWQVTFSDRYISNPPLGLKGNDLLLSTGLRLTVGKGIF